MPGVTLSDVCAEHRRQYPDKVAVIDGSVRLTWPELDGRVDGAARLLAQRGVRRGDRVLWLAQTSFRFLELMIACSRLGAMICAANWRQSAEEFAFVIDDFDPKVIVWQQEEIGHRVEAARSLAGTSATWIQHDTEAADAYENLLATAGDNPVARASEPDDAVFVIYTAAISGRPNGSMLSNRNLIAMATVTGPVTGASNDSVFINSGPLFHIGNFQFDAMPVFVAGGTNVYVRRVQADELLNIIATERVTSAFLMPPTILEMKALNESRKLDISCLRAGALAPVWGDALPPDTTAWSASGGGFGQTEVTGLAVLNAFGGRGIGNSGRPSPMSLVRIVDAEGTEVPNGSTGEITIKGDTVHLGYWNRPEVNAARMRNGWWHTTDCGRRESDGTIHFIGTMTRMIKSAAENIYPPEVESCLTSHPAIKEAAIIGVPDARFTQSVKAVVTLEDGATVSAEEIIEHCRARIASYKKPKTVEFIDALPRSGGATDYDALDRMFGGGGYPGGINVRG
ncbi:AMP-binding protein [Mycobacterium sp.]|uniref:AMP-binding protein n=1 Tax=Mycobacterium sp. TaxID=1785 RepID=UPI00121278D8|nr:AMP-binding protein [Mycobacterium sp.]TAM65164.1 MAG: acyl-CoA synthetase [Mycobacterium sp.]